MYKVSVPLYYGILSGNEREKILEEVRKNVKERFNIDHVALQPEWESTEATTSDCDCKARV